MGDELTAPLPVAELPVGTVTFLFTDIEGSTNLLKQLSERYADLLRDQREILRACFTKWNGREVDTQGDSFFYSFPRATQAVAAAVEIQQNLAAHTWPEGVQVRVRMGLHTGEPLEVSQEGYVGLDVHRAARIAHAGHGGQVLLSETTTPLVQNELPTGVSLLDLGRHLLKDMPRPEHIRQLVIDGLPSEYPPLKSLDIVLPEELRAPRAVGKCPYRGLSAFREEDVPFFFGRELFTEQLLEAVKTRPWVAVIVGSSGSGKSSAVFAGLLPQLRESGNWQITVLRPGSQPFYSLAGALLPTLEPGLGETDRLAETRNLAERLMAGEVSLFQVIDRVLRKESQSKQLLLVIDQFEELYTLCPDVETQHGFIDTLLTAMAESGQPRQPPIVVLLTMRADFMGQALSYRPLADALQAASLIMGPMNQEELRAVIEKPAEVQGATFEPGLVERILHDVGQEPGNLPLLEFALTLLWERQSDGWLTHEDYEALGGVQGALASYADEIYAGLEEIEREAAHQIFVQLVRPGEGTEDTRRMATREELGEEHWGLIQYLADKRLVVTGREVRTGFEIVEVVHEALIRRWEKIRAWMESDRTFRTWQERLRVALRQWEISDQDARALLRGIPLAEAERWLATRGRELSVAEEKYIQASLAERLRREALKRARQERELALERRSHQRLRVIIGVLLAALAVGSMLITAVFWQRRVALRAAEENQSIALSVSAEQAFNEGQRELALALAIEANRIAEPPSQVRQTLYNMAYQPGARLVIATGGPMGALATSPDGRYTLYSAAEWNDPSNEVDFAVHLVDIETGAEVRQYAGHQGYVTALDFSLDGRTFVSGSMDNLVIWWEVDTGEILQQHELPTNTGAVRHLACSPDGQTVMIQTGDVQARNMYLRRMDIRTGEILQQYESDADEITDLHFTPDGRAIIALEKKDLGGRHNYFFLTMWEVETGEILRQFDAPEFTAVAWARFDISPVAKTSLMGSYDGEVAILNLETGEVLRYLYSQRHNVSTDAVAISPDGKTAAAGIPDGGICQWDLATGEEIICLYGHTGHIAGVDFTPDGLHVVSGSEDGTIRVWELTYGNEIMRFSPADVAGFWSIALSNDGQYAFTGAGSSTWDLPPGEPLEPNFVYPAENNALIMWSTESGEEIRRFAGHGFSLWQIDIHPAGHQVLTGARYEGMRLWDLETGEQIRHFPDESGITTIDISPDGRSVLSGSWDPDPELCLWDLQTGEIIRRWDFPDSEWIASVEFLPGGERALISLWGGDIFLWDLATGLEIKRFEGHFNWTRLKLGPDNHTFLSSSFDGTSRLWDLDTGAELYQFEGGYGGAVALSPDNRLALVPAGGSGVGVWDLERHEPIGRFSLGGLVTAGTFSPDGRHFYTASWDGTARKWETPLLDIEELIDWVGENRYVPEFTPEQREFYRLESGVDKNSSG